MIRGKINPNTKRPSNCATISERKVEQELKQAVEFRAGSLDGGTLAPESITIVGKIDCPTYA
jgi:hypothetical protein